MVLEISRLFRLKSWLPKWPCHSTYIFIAIIFVHRTWHLHWRVSSSWVDYAHWPMLGWKGWTFWMFQDRTKFSTFSKLGKWSDEMLAPRNIPTASRRVDESKSRKSTYGKSRDTTKVEVKYRKYIKKMKYHDKTKFSTFSTSGLVKWFCDVLAARNWIFCQKSAILKKHKICAWKDDTYIAFWEVAKYQGIRGKYRAISEKRWIEYRRSEERWKE